MLLLCVTKRSSYKIASENCSIETVRYIYTNHNKIGMSLFYATAAFLCYLRNYSFATIKFVCTFYFNKS